MKKQWISLMAVIAILGSVACSNDRTNEDATSNTTTGSTDGTEVAETRTASYVDLNSGKEVEMEVNTRTRVASPKLPESGTVTYYVDPASKDTVEASTGRIVSGAMVKGEDGTWTVDETKVKVDGDELKVKIGEDEKLKVDGEDVKYKNGEDKVKKDGEEYKEKSGDSKIKADGDELKIKSKKQ